MAGGVISEALSFAPGSASAVALLATLPLLFVFYVRYLIAVKTHPPTLSLRELESIELQRAVRWYARASKRIEDVYRERRQQGRTRHRWDRGRDNTGQQIHEELA